MHNTTLRCKYNYICITLRSTTCVDSSTAWTIFCHGVSATILSCTIHVPLFRLVAAKLYKQNSEKSKAASTFAMLHAQVVRHDLLMNSCGAIVLIHCLSMHSLCLVHIGTGTLRPLLSRVHTHLAALYLLLLFAAKNGKKSLRRGV